MAFPPLPRHAARRADDHPIRSGMLIGLLIGLGYSGLASARMLGVLLRRGEGLGLAFWLWLKVSGLYLVGGVLAGTVVGALQPLRRWYLGRLLTAYVVVLIAYGGALLAVPWLLPDRAPLALPYGWLALLGVPVAVLGLFVFEYGA